MSYFNNKSIQGDIEMLLTKGWSVEQIVEMYASNPAGVTKWKVEDVKRSLQKKYKTSKLDPKTNGLITWLKADKLFK